MLGSGGLPKMGQKARLDCFWPGFIWNLARAMGWKDEKVDLPARRI